MKIAGDLLLQMALLGLDSLVAGLVLGPMMRDRALRATFILLFGLCDGAAVLLGASLTHRPPDPPAVLLYALVAAAVLLATRHSQRWLLLTPVILSFDNLAAGAPASEAAALGIWSAAIALAGVVASTAAVRASAGLGRRAAHNGVGAL